MTVLRSLPATVLILMLFVLRAERAILNLTCCFFRDHVANDFRQLQVLLRVAKVGEAPTESGVVAPGMVVTVRYEGDDETETFLLGSREEGTHGDLEVYSPNSPMGKAIIGAREGEERKYELPNGGSMSVTVVRADPYRG